MQAYNLILQVVMWVLILGGLFTEDYLLVLSGLVVGAMAIIGMWVMGRMEFGSWTWWRN